MRKLILSGIVAVFACAFANAAEKTIEGELKKISKKDTKDSDEKLFECVVLVDGKEITHHVSGKQEVTLHIGKTTKKITTADFFDWQKENPKAAVKIRLKLSDEGKITSLITCVDGTPWP